MKTCPIFAATGRDVAGALYTPYACITDECAWWIESPEFGACAIAADAHSAARRAKNALLFKNGAREWSPLDPPRQPATPPGNGHGTAKSPLPHQLPKITITPASKR